MNLWEVGQGEDNLPSFCLELAAVGDDDRAAGLATLGANGLDLLDDVHALNNRAENDVLKKELDMDVR